MKKIIILLILILIIPFFLTGCYDSISLEKFYYAVAIAIDSSKSSDIKLSVQIATSSSHKSDSSSQSNEYAIYSVDCENLDTGINILNNYLSKQINLSHCSAIIFSEELAKKGIGKYINTLANNPEIRPTVNLIISNTTGYDVLENVSNSGENFSARYYEFIIKTINHTGYSINSQFGRFFYDMNSNLNDTLTNYVIVNNKIVQSVGIALFKEDKLIGNLSPLQSLAHLIVTNKINESTISIPNPFNPDSTIELLVQKHQKTKNNISLLNNKPFLKTNVQLNCRILSADTNFDYSSDQALSLIQDQTNNYIKNLIEDYYYSIIKLYNSDITNLGEQMASNYLTQKDFEKINWKSIYKDTFYSVNVDTIISTSLFTKK